VFASIEPDLEDSPVEAVAELSDLVGGCWRSAYDLDDPVVRGGEEREVVGEYLAAREIADRVKFGQNVDPGDAAAAINGLRAIYDFVIAELEAP
jgi:hypothetical protein